jgi:hypothetical protein
MTLQERTAETQSAQGLLYNRSLHPLRFCDGMSFVQEPR